MFIEIKLEPKDIDSDKAPANHGATLKFEVENDATIKAIKLQIEKHISVAADKQEIKTLSKTYNNNDKIYEILELKKVLETTLMLYIYDSDDCSENFCDGTGEDPKFHCFLQLYENEKNEKIFAAMPNYMITNKILVVSDLESNDEEETTTCSTKSSISSSPDSSDDSESSKNVIETKNSRISRKRSAENSKSNESAKKRNMSLNSIFSPTLNSYLDEFPKYTTTDSNSKQCNNKQLQKNQEKEQFPNVLVVQSNATIIQSQGISFNSKAKREEIQCNAASSSSLSPSAERHNPCSEISPEKREYVIIISNEDDKCNLNDSDFNELLNMFFDRFRQSDSDMFVARLQFNEISAIVLVAGKVWISCDDEFSFQWISENIKKFTPTYKAERLRDYLQLQKCVVIIPGICKSNKFEDIFDLLEKQNCNLCTKHWVVQERRIITDENDEYFDKAISHISFNHVLFLFIDIESKELLEKINYKLKYCFWKIVFEMKDFKKVN